MASTEALIPIIGKLQDVWATLGHRSNEIELPQIIVVGSQSAGKSSVIEGIVGRDFLPRGMGLVTRCPLLIHLHHTPANSFKRQKDDTYLNGAWAEFQHAQGDFYTDFDEVRKEIDAQTDRLSGTNKGITNNAIRLHIYSQNVVNLSLVDLPGTVKNPIGDQPHDIEDQVRNMILSYIQNEKSIILAVSEATADIATSDSLKLARQVDPEGNRTLGVLTKLDIMNPGTDAMDVLMNKLLSVKLGIIGVVNRSQKDINEEKSMQDCRKDESKFLKKKYPSIASKNGIPYLVKTLNQLLIRHIQKCLPDLKLEVAKQLLRYEEMLDLYGEPVTDKGKTLLQIIGHFAIAYKSDLEENPKNTTELARFCNVNYKNFARSIDEINAMDGLSLDEIVRTIKNASGIRSSILIPETAFDLLVRKQMQRFQQPMLEYIEAVHRELKRIIQYCGSEIQQEMERFPRLRTQIIKVVNGILEKRVGLTKTFAQEYLNVHLSSINTEHPDFCKVAKKLLPRNLSRKNENNAGGDGDCKVAEEKTACEITGKLISTYFTIIQKQIKDVVPKAIMNFLINYLRQNLHNELVHALYLQNVTELMVEDEEVEEKRKDASEMLEALKKATMVLSEINDAHV